MKGGTTMDKYQKLTNEVGTPVADNDLGAASTAIPVQHACAYKSIF